MDAALYNALPKSLRTKELRATQMVVLPCPCHCGTLVREPGHETHLVRTSRLAPDILLCDCQANSFGTQCSHIIAAKTHTPHSSPSKESQ